MSHNRYVLLFSLAKSKYASKRMDEDLLPGFEDSAVYVMNADSAQYKKFGDVPERSVKKEHAQKIADATKDIWFTICKKNYDKAVIITPPDAPNFTYGFHNLPFETLAERFTEWGFTVLDAESFLELAPPRLRKVPTPPVRKNIESLEALLAEAGDSFEKAGLPKTKIHALVPTTKKAISRVGGDPFGISYESWPRYERYEEVVLPYWVDPHDWNGDTRMEHVLTVDLRLPGLDLPDASAAVSLFVSHMETEDGLWDIDSKEVVVKLLSSADLDAGPVKLARPMQNPANEPRRECYLECLSFEIPRVVFIANCFDGKNNIELIANTDDEQEIFSSYQIAPENQKLIEPLIAAVKAGKITEQDVSMLHKLHFSVKGLSGIIGERPLWIQGAEPFAGEFLLQFDETLVPDLKMGDAGILYLFTTGALLQSH